MYELGKSDDGFPNGLQKAREIEDRCHTLSETHPKIAEAYRNKCLEYRMSTLPPEEKKLNTNSQKQET